jgi:tetratricopeptide (TPR) repeat protein
VRLGKNVAWLDGVYRRLPSVHRPWVLYMPVLPDWFSGMVSVLIMLLLLGTGFVTAVVVRPTTRHAAVAAGLAVGFITAVTTLLMALGGFMMQMETQSAIEYDLTILSDAAFTRAAPGEPHPSDRLLARYPDLQRVPPGERGHLIRDKILGDSLAGILVGLWLGAASALLLSLVPLVSGTVAAWSLLQRHGSVLGALFPYTELTFTVTILAGVIVHWVLGPLATSYILFPEVPWLLAVLAASSLGVIAICLRWPITVRLLVHLVWIGALVLLIVHEADYGTTEGRAARLVQAGQFSAAAEQLEQILQRQPDLADTRFRAAIVWLRAGDQEHYERHCQKLLADARQTSDPSVADKAAKVCLLGGDHVPDLAEATKLADQAVRLGAGHEWTNYYELVRGMAAYRNQQDKEALNWLRKCQAAKNRFSATTALVFEAMALQRQGSHVDALQALEHADTMFRELKGSRAASADWPSGFNWIDLVIFEIARREAARVVEQAPAQP